MKAYTVNKDTQYIRYHYIINTKKASTVKGTQYMLYNDIISTMEASTVNIDTQNILYNCMTNTMKRRTVNKGMHTRSIKVHNNTL